MAIAESQASDSPSLSEVQDTFHTFVTRDEFPCLGARATVGQDACTIDLFGSLGDDRDIARLSDHLHRFGKSIEESDRSYNSFVAVFPSLPPNTEAEFDERAWKHLQLLSDSDKSSSWASGRSDKPNDPEFSFSFAGVPYFVVGLFPLSSRTARQFAWPALVFNPHALFDRLREDGNYERMKSLIRERDVALQGTLNPNLADFGEISEARQYTGARHGHEWQCPFHRKAG